MVKLSDILKNQRKLLGYELSQVSEHTKIPINKLEALEKGQYEAFDSEVFLKGFLKNYIKFLDLDYEKTIAIYRREREIQKESSIANTSTSESEDKPGFILTPTKVLITIIVFLALALFTFVAIQVNRIIKPPDLVLTDPLEARAPEEKIFETSAASITLKGTVESGSILTVNGNKINTNNLQEFQISDFSLEEGSNIIEIQAENQFLKKNTIKINVVRNTSENPVVQDFTNSQSTSSEDSQTITNFNIKLEVTGEPSWIVATVDGNQVIANVVGTGEKFEFTPRSTFTINTPRPNMIKLLIDDKEEPVPSSVETTWRLTNGTVKKVE